MSTLIIAALIAIAAFLAVRNYIAKKGSCGDCDCDCGVKDEMRKSSVHK